MQWFHIYHLSQNLSLFCTIIPHSTNFVPFPQSFNYIVLWHIIWSNFHTNNRNQPKLIICRDKTCFKSQAIKYFITNLEQVSTCLKDASIKPKIVPIRGWHKFCSIVLEFGQYRYVSSMSYCNLIMWKYMVHIFLGTFWNYL